MEIEEVIKFIQLGSRLDLKSIALEYIIGLTGSEEGLKLLIGTPQLLISLISLLHDNSSPIAKDASFSLINISANEEGANKLLKLDTTEHCPPLQKPPNNIVLELLENIFNENSLIADKCCTILSNLTRPSFLVEKIINLIEESDRTFDQLINIFTKKQFNKNGCKLDYLGPVLSNLSQSSRMRRYILDKEKCVIQKLLPFTEYQESFIKRGGIVGTLKNCCFESDDHEWLLSEDVDILPRLLLPLAGSEEFDDEDNDKLPLELQYLGDEKTREEDPDIRCILLEAITQLCDKKANRQFIRDKNTYVILRELHKWEKDKKAIIACENLVDILIRTEEEIGYDNLKEIEIPEEMKDNFIKMDQELAKQ